ncbi:hypothetical protein COLO4_22232 [Corchorus olitorius]|uniref:Reverse transcriptase n=1 Tax=Corchorus olitorius TaxID=93759 RepID=A0A1R3INC4_9ROSI|nr:hypothetical protein COLO4_22232 [Corchorus olitorius]
MIEESGPTTLGQYSVKSGYYAIKCNAVTSQNPNKASSSHRIDKDLWNIVWNINCPKKIRTFLWRCCRNALPTAVGLYKRNCRASGICSICGQYDETIEHLLLSCDWTRGIWLSICGLQIDKQSISTFDDWLASVVKKLQGLSDAGQMILMKIAFTYWIIWKVRCEVVITHVELQPDRVVYRLQRAIGEYELAKFIAATRNVKNNEVGSDHHTWTKPDEGFLKLNSDGSFYASERSAGIGVVIRNHEGQVIDAYGKKVSACSALSVEALALRDAALLAVQRDYMKVCFEIDSSELLRNITCTRFEHLDWRISPIILDIQSLLHSFENQQVRKINRSANKAAY